MHKVSNLTSFPSTFSFLLILIVLSFVILDGIVTSLPFYNVQTQRAFGMLILFAGEIFLFSTIQIMILKLIRNDFRVGAFTRNFLKFINLTYLTTLLVQCAIITLLLTIVFEISWFSQYHSIIVRWTLSMSISLSFALLSILSFKFVQWALRRPDYLTIVYAAAAILLSINSAIFGLFMALELQSAPVIITSFRMPIATSHVTNVELNETQSNIAQVSFVTLWFASTLLLRRRIKKGNKLVFYVLICIPLIYYLGIFHLVLSKLLFDSDVLNAFQVYTFNIVNSALSRPVGGAVFGIAFWVIANKIEDQGIRNFMKFSSIGIILLSVSNQDEAIYLLPYPPFGLPSISFMGISSYLLLIGLYYSAALTSVNTKIRSMIERSINKELTFLSNIGRSQMEAEIEHKVRSITKSFANELEDETGIQVALTKDEIKEHIELVLRERQLTLDEKLSRVGIYEPGDNPSGRTWDQWVELWWRWCHRSPQVSPAQDLDGSHCLEGQIHGDVWFLAGTFGGRADRRCIIPYGKSIFFPVVNDIISFATDPQLKSEEELMRYAKADLDTTRILSVKIDGAPLEGLTRYRVITRPFEISLPITGDKTSLHETIAVSDGFWVFLKPLSLGDHKIEILGEKLAFDNIQPGSDAEKGQLFRVETIYHLTISNGSS
jgi:hypothetical protein